MRKIIQIACAMTDGGFAGNFNLLVYALCDDDTVWVRNPNHPDNKKREQWFKIQNIPQD